MKLHYNYKLLITIKLIRTNFQIRFGYIPHLSDHIKTLPKDQIQTKMEARTHDGKHFEDWFRVCNIAGLCKVILYCNKNNIPHQFENIKEDHQQKIEQWVKNKELLEQKVKDFRENGVDVSNIDYSFMKIQPYVYQKEGAYFLELTNGNAIIGDQPGVGKSLQPIVYAIKNKLKRVLIICPASLKLNWRNEIVKFTNEKGFIFKHTKKRKEKTELFSKEESLFHIINYESLETYLKFDVHHKCNDKNCGWEETSKIKKHKFCPKCLKTKTVKSRNSELCTFYDKKGIELNASDYEAIVLDEAHYIGNEKSNRTKLVKAAFKNSPRKILLTGTAINNRPYEFFPLLSFIDQHEFVNSHHFGLKYCDGKEDEYGYWKYDGFSNLDELYKRISYIFIRRLKKDVLEHLPPKTFTVIKIELTPEERKEYDKLENQIVDETSESDDKMTHLARVQKLKQFTSRIRAERAIEFIKNIIDGGEKIVVFSQFIATLDYIQSHFKEISVKFDGKLTMQQKQECVDRFMTDDSCMLFAASAGAAKEGITLTSASISMFLDDLWTSTRREQCEDRIHRASQTSDKVQIIRLICEDTIDEELNRLLDEKEKVVTKVLDGESIVNDIAFSIFEDVVKIILAKKNKK